MADEIKKAILEAVRVAYPQVELAVREIALEHPVAEEHGDYSSNIALRLGKQLGQNSYEVAEKIAAGVQAAMVEKVEVAGPGFINFYLSEEWLVKAMDEKDGREKSLSGKEVVVEFTDPNLFKELHVGHVYSNSVGESICRLLEASGATVHRVTYQGDVGLHVAKSIWEIEKIKAEMPKESADLEKKAAFLGKAYTLGATAYEEDEKAKGEMDQLNRKIYEQDPEIKEVFEKGKRWSLEYFEKFYRILGTKFEHNYFESEAGKVGLDLVKKSLATGIFEESDGAVIFRGDKYGLHTRVFVNKFGLPTYEAKELGLAPTKYRDYKYDQSIIITGNEIDEYFRVLLKALSLLSPDLAAKTIHIGHGMVRLPTGKMSSRTGKVLTAPWLISEAEKLAEKKMEEKSLATEEDAAQKVAVAAIKYALLRSSIGKDVEFDFEKSIDFEGDSGPYLQYTYARARSVLRKSKVKRQNAKIQVKNQKLEPEEMAVLRWLYRFPEVVEVAAKQYAPNLVCSYLFELAKRYNNLYNNVPILGPLMRASVSSSGLNNLPILGELLRSSSANRRTAGLNNCPVLGDSLRLELTEATAAVLKNGLNLLGIEVLERM